MVNSMKCLVVALAVLVVAGCGNGKTEGRPGNSGSWSFGGGGGGAGASAVVSLVTPANGTTGVAPNSAISATFSTTMLGSSFTSTSFRVNDGITDIAGTITASGSTATFTPTAELTINTLYTVTLTTGVQDANGTPLPTDYAWSFTTGSSNDVTAPTVTATAPARNSTGAAINGAITATFSEPMTSATISGTTFTLKTSSGNVPVLGTVSYSGSTATFTPSVSLVNSTSYIATITTGVKDLAGNPLASIYVWSFTTDAAPDTTPPTVVSTYPSDAATVFPVNGALEINFSESMDAATINTANILLAGPSGTVGGTVTASGTSAIFRPSANLDLSTSYTATVTTGVKDLAGNAMALDFIWNFNTGNSALTGGEIQGTTLSLAPTVSTLAGSAGVTGVTDGTGAAARFFRPVGITTDGPNLYVADWVNSNIRKIVIATGVVTTLAGDSSKPGSTDGTGTAANFSSPLWLTTDGINLYVSDNGNSTIRKIVISSGVVTTLAGTAGASGSTDGTGAAARFFYPRGITTDGTNLYLTDNGNHTIRQIVIATGVVTTLAGTVGASGSADGIGTAATFQYPAGITTDGTNLFVADTQNSTIRQIEISTGAVTTLAGSASITGTTDGTGTAARFNYPSGITTDGTNLYVSDSNNHNIRMIVISTGVVTTLAGGTDSISSNNIGSTDGTGAAARFWYPGGITTDGVKLFVGDEYNSTIRVIQ